MEKEKDFQIQADEAASRFVETARVLLVALSNAVENDDEEVREDLIQEIEEYPLSVTVRAGWYFPGEELSLQPEEFQILLYTGGPAGRIIGTLDGHGCPDSARFEYQDWFKPWTAAQMSGEDQDVLIGNNIVGSSRVGGEL